MKFDGRSVDTGHLYHRRLRRRAASVTLPPMATALERLGELQARVDGFFAGVHDRHRVAMSCGAGCHACCQPGLSITAIEAVAVDAELARLPAGRRATLRERAQVGEGAACAALESDGRCAVYPARPLVCRSHGVPVRVIDDRTHLPVVQACSLNFTGGLPGDPADTLDQAILSTILAALDAAHAAEAGCSRDRVAIRDLVAG
jgi:hypothetical protein